MDELLLSEMTYDDYLSHYGVKGMKWGVRKRASNLKSRGAKKIKSTSKSISDSRAAKKDAEIIYNNESKVFGDKSAARAARKRARKASGESEKYKQTFEKHSKNLEKGRTAKQIGKGVAQTAAAAYAVDQMFNGGRGARATVRASSAILSKTTKVGRDFAKSQDSHVYINPDGSLYRGKRPTF